MSAFAGGMHVPHPAVARLALGLVLAVAIGAVVLARFAVVARVTRAGRQLTSELVPRLFAVTTFLAGVILLFSGATPAHSGRMGWLSDVLPLPVIELSAYFVSFVGVALILLARGIQRRLDAAYHLTLWLLAGGCAVAMTSAADVGQAALLAMMFAALFPCRRYFYRRSSLFDERFTHGWGAAILGVVTATAALAYLAYGHAIIDSEVFWKFGGQAQAPRAARAITIAVLTLLVLSLARLLRPSRVRRNTEADPALIERIVRASPLASAHLALLGDKDFLVDDSGQAFIMYAGSGTSRVVMGDPVGPAHIGTKLIDTFVEQCRREGSWPVFYRVSPHLLYRYLDYGLSAVKLGEVARVPLADFSLEGAHRRNLRRVWRKLVDAGCSFAVIAREEVPEVLAELREVSDDWLDQKRAREKGFSLGCFDEAFVSHGPVGVVRQGGRIIAFGTLWVAGDRAEVEIDLMRHLAAAPPGVMRYLLIELMLWARREGFARFSLGMAPLAGVVAGHHAPVWNRLVSAVRITGEQYYNFNGLREFKDWFYPEWEPSYLVSPGGSKRPLIVANIASLISGGTRGILRR